MSGLTLRSVLATIFGGGALPAPTLSTADPDVGDTDGIHASTITLTGTNFVSGCTVTIGGTSATSVTFVNSTTVTCKPPAKASGQYDIVLTNPDTQNATLSNGYRAWTPAEITGVAFAGDCIKGVTLASGKVSVWTNQKSGVTVSTAQQGTAGNRPTRVADHFGTGLDAFQFTPQNFLSAYDGGGFLVRDSMIASGYTWLAVLAWTSSDNTPAGASSINCPLTVYGDSVGWGSGGLSAGQVCIAQFPAVTSDAVGTDSRRSSGLNDGNVRLVGYSFSTANIGKGYVDGAQAGSDMSATFDTTNSAWDQIGAGYTGIDGFDGYMGAFVVVDGVISATDHGRLHKWKRLRFGGT